MRASAAVFCNEVVYIKQCAGKANLPWVRVSVGRESSRDDDDEAVDNAGSADGGGADPARRGQVQQEPRQRIHVVVSFETLFVSLYSYKLLKVR